MTHIIQNSSRLFMLAIIVILMAVGAGCKSKKKAAEASNAAAEKARLEQEMALRKQKELEEEEARKRQAEENTKKATENVNRDSYARLSQYFNAIASSGNTTAANNSINEALSLFASGETPVLIVISESGGQKDYDRPTTIRDYLNYLKDQKKNINKIGNLQFDSAGRITEVELIKQK